MARTVGVTFSVGASMASSVASVFQTVDARVRGLKGNLKDLQTVSARAAALTTAEARLQAARAARAANPTEKNWRELRSAQTAYRSAERAAQKYNISVAEAAKVHDRATAAIARTEAALGRQQRLQANQAKRQELHGQVMGAVAMAATVATPVSAAIGFESAMADAAKTIDGMRDSQGALTAQYYQTEAAVKRLGRQIPLTHRELAALFAVGGQEGLTDPAALEEFTTLASHMSVAFDMAATDSAEAVGGFRTSLKLTMPQVRELLDLMNQYANTGSASEKGIADIVRRVGNLGNVGGVAAKPMTALAATLDAMKVESEVAATGIKNLILGLTSGAAATKKQRAALAGLGIDTIKLAQAMQKDAPRAILSVLSAVQRLPKARQLSTLQQIFGRESLGAIAPLLDNLDLVRENLLISADTAAYAGAMQKEFENRSRTTANALRLAGNRAAELGINLGTVALPAIVRVLDVVNPYTSALAELATQHQGVTTAAFATVAVLVALKVGGLAVAYTATLVSDAWTLAKGVFAGARAVVAACTSGLIANRAASLATAVASRTVAAAQWTVNAAMAANPIGAVVVGVGALAAGMVWLYQTCEPVRAAVDGVWAVVRKLGVAIGSEFMTSIKLFGQGVVEAFDAVASKFQWLADAWKTVQGWLPAGLGGEDLIAEAADQQVRADRRSGGAVAVTTPVSVAPAASHARAQAAPAQAVAFSPAQSAAQSSPSAPAAAGAPALPRSPAAAAGGVSMQAAINLSVNLNGVPSKDIGEVLVAAIKSKDGELKTYFERLLSSIAADQSRLAYDR